MVVVINFSDISINSNFSADSMIAVYNANIIKLWDSTKCGDRKIEKLGLYQSVETFNKQIAINKESSDVNKWAIHKVRTQIGGRGSHDESV